MSRHIRLQNGRVALVGADRHPHAARQLRTRVPGLDWVDLASEQEAGPDVPVVTLSSDDSQVEGAFRLSSTNGEGAPRICVSGGPFSGVIYGADALATRLAAGEALPAEVVETPGLPYRTFWNWDHSTNWELSQVGHQEIGVFNPWGKPPGGFLADMKRAVDFMSRHRISALVIYGFLRDSHGGIEAAQELCTYATERGVRILPGVAIGAYGGCYWEGDHRYNLATWLDQNPQFAADMEKGVGFQLEDLAFPLSFPRSDYTRSACPSAPETMDWMTEAVTWLAENFEIGGINIESGDYGVCGCARCQQRRGDREDAARRSGDDEFWSHADMADNFPRLFEAARSVTDDLWMYCELQWDNLFDAEAHKPLAALPDGGIYQHTFNKSYWQRTKDRLTSSVVRGLPTNPNVLRCQFACQWNGDERTERYHDNSAVFAEMSKAAHSCGMQGLTVWGEPSPFHTGSELSYLAFGRFGYSPDLTWDDFIATDVGPLLGGPEAAQTYLSVMHEMDDHQSLPLDRLDDLLGQVREGARQLGGEPYRRWHYLENRLLQRRYMRR